MRGFKFIVQNGIYIIYYKLRQMGQGQSNAPESSSSGCLNLCVSRRYYMRKQIQKTIEQYNRQPIQFNTYERQNKNKIQNVKSLPKFNMQNEKDRKKCSYDKYKQTKKQQKKQIKDSNEKNKMKIDKLSTQVILLGLQSNVIQKSEPKSDTQNYKPDQTDQKNQAKPNTNNNGTHITGQGLGITVNQQGQDGISQNQKQSISIYQNSLSSNKFSISMNSNKQLLVNKIQSLKQKYVKHQGKIQNQKCTDSTDNNKNIIIKKEKELDLDQNMTTPDKNDKQKGNQSLTCEKSLNLSNQRKKSNQIQQINQSESHQMINEITYKANSKDNNTNPDYKSEQKQIDVILQYSTQNFKHSQPNNESIKNQTLNRNQITEIVQFFSESSSESSSNHSTQQNDEFFFTSQHIFGNKINLAKKPLQVKQNQIISKSKAPEKRIYNNLQKNRVNIAQSVKTQNKNDLQSQNISRGSRKIMSLNCTKLITF